MKRIRSMTAFAAVAASLFAVSCATMRSDFEAIGERALYDAESTALLSTWEIGPGSSDSVVAEEKAGRRFLVFRAPAGMTLAGSLVGDFTLAFSLRLDQGSDPFAMINFRNYFNRRYCLIVSPEGISLEAAKIRHSQLSRLDSAKVTSSPGTWQRFEIAAAGNEIKVFKNGQLVLSHTDADDPIAAGNIWFENHSRYSFADVSVSKIDAFARKEKAPPRSDAKPAAAERPRIPLVAAGLAGRDLAAHEASLLSDLLAAALVSTGTFRVLERSELDKVLAEQELQLSGTTDLESAVGIGRVLNAVYLVTGSAGALGNGYVVVVKLVRIETGETEAVANRDFADVADIASGMRSVAAELAAKAKP